MEVHRVAPDDLPTVAATLAGAFQDDPAWSWVFADPDARPTQLAAVWALLLEGSVEYGWVWSTLAAEAVTLWVPPGTPELAEPQAALLGPLVHELLGPDVGRWTH